VIGSGVIQLNIIIGTIIASFLPIGAISHIYYADRLNQLPLAIFGIAIGTVLLPSLSRAIKQNKKEEIEVTQNRSLEFCLLISLPSAAGLFILSAPIINILFERGAFLSADTLYTAQVLSIFSLGLPAHILIKVLVVCFFAREDTKTPLYISLVSVIINIVLSLLLIESLREMGIATATAISAWVNTLLLFIVLRSKDNLVLGAQLIRNSFKITISMIVMVVGCYFLNALLFINIADLGSLLKIGFLVLIIV
ncbi:uncharacterized protein METZ01_LOCUS461148, partial [marine metagenome]